MSKPDTTTTTESTSSRLDRSSARGILSIVFGLVLISFAATGPVAGATAGPSCAAVPADSTVAASALPGTMPSTLSAPATMSTDAPSASETKETLCDSAFGKLLGGVNLIIIFLGLMVALTSYELASLKNMLGGGKESKKRAKQQKANITSEAMTLLAVPSLYEITALLTPLPSISCVLPNIL